MMIQKDKVNMINQRFGKLVVLSLSDYTDKYNHKYYLCKCDCGKTKIISKDNLMSGNTQSCGCSKENTKMIGKRYGNLIVLENSNLVLSKNRLWKCQCDCGNIIYVPTYKLCNNIITSCGCIAKVRKSTTKTKRNVYVKKDNYYIVTDETGFQFIIDIDDYDKLKDDYWTKHPTSNTIYANNYSKTKTGQTLWRLILNDTIKRHRISYKNNNYLDLRKENLVIRNED